MSITSKWSEPAVSYFEGELKSDIIKYAGKWLLEEFDGLYDPYSGITNNLSESYNAVKTAGSDHFEAIDIEQSKNSSSES
jgi:hypothetical protein